jgi:hypothetical protein
MAYGVYAPARYTHNLNILAPHAERADIERAFVAIGIEPEQLTLDHMVFRDRACGVAVNVMLGTTGPIRSAVESPVLYDILGLNTRVIEPEYLLWLYCISASSKHLVDAVELIKIGGVSTHKVRRHLAIGSERGLLRKLRVFEIEAERIQFSSYENSRRDRISPVSPE